MWVELERGCKPVPLLDYVNIRQGTASTPSFSHGNTLPLTQRPFGMAAFAPQTARGGNWFYHPDAATLDGVRLTHQPSPWVGDFGALLLTPQAGEPSFAPQSAYSPADALLAPHYMRLDFLRCGCTFELTPTARGAIMRYAFANDADAPFLSLLPIAGNATFTADAPHNRLYGTTDHISVPTETAPFCMHFVLEFDGDVLWEHSTLSGDGAHVALASPSGTVRLSTSYISAAQALKNLQSECGKQPFDTLVAQAADAWESLLSRVQIDTDDTALRRTFYSCLYRTLLFPHKAYEWDADHNPVHFDPNAGGVKAGYAYTNNGFWDTYRTVYPLLSLVAPDILPEILQGFLQSYRDCGWLPRWPSMREFGIMPGTLIDAVLADGAVKGMLSRDDMALALTAMRKHAENEGAHPFGRRAVAFYQKHGFVPNTVPESVTQTLDYAYGDFCIAQMAALLGDKQTEDIYRRRAQNYRHLYDPATDFMRGRNEAGEMTDPETFEPFAWGGDYTEGGAWQSSFAVPHDIDGLASLYGGRDAFLQKLDTLFGTPPHYSVGAYGFVIHEMAEMAACDYGQCAISNQPSFHYPWLYAALGEADKATYWVQRMAREVFSADADGFPGDEDNGTMAAWFIFAVLGFYPLCPGRAEYIRTAPLVQAASIRGKAVPYAQSGTHFSQKDLT
ncbi:MAG: GH92 family glycosyl hydrolase [Clostridia bacterium]|nr:GH92 family glycosyl hydrolase [Clostridia bacterium]